MKALRITLKRLREVLGLLKMLDAEFRKIKRQKFVLFTILAACLFPHSAYSTYGTCKTEL